MSNRKEPARKVDPKAEFMTYTALCQQKDTSEPDTAAVNQLIDGSKLGMRGSSYGGMLLNRRITGSYCRLISTQISVP